MPKTLRKLPLIAVLSVQIAIPPAAYAGTTDLPDLGDESAAVITPAEERKLGEDFMRKARHSLAFVDDPELNDYIQSLGQKLANSTEDRKSTRLNSSH